MYFYILSWFDPVCTNIIQYWILVCVDVKTECYDDRNLARSTTTTNNNDRLTAFDPGQPG